VVKSVIAVRSNREPNCEEVNESVTIVIENTTPESVIIAPEIKESVARAVSALIKSHLNGPFSSRQI